MSAAALANAYQDTGDHVPCPCPGTQRWLSSSPRVEDRPLPLPVVMLRSDPFLRGTVAVGVVLLTAPLGSVPTEFVGGHTCCSLVWGGREGGSPCGCSQHKGGFSRKQKVSPTATAVAPTWCPAEISV